MDYRNIIIDGIETNYEIKKCGTIFNKYTGKILKPYTLISGYSQVILTIFGLRKHMYIHRLVALAFLPNPDNKRCIDHIDGNKLNNCLENLRYATHQENSRNRMISINNTSGYKGVNYDKIINMKILSIFNANF